ncbi:hypothetical protein SAZ11_10285 [Streptomyces sp. FXJ1.4098]|nr:hypothetical protein [Streptomyces sp. FXJ1.4098]
MGLAGAGATPCPPMPGRARGAARPAAGGGRVPMAARARRGAAAVAAYAAAPRWEADGRAEP